MGVVYVSAVDGEVALSDELTDPSPGHAAEVQEADAAVSEVVGRPEGNAGGCAGLRDGRAERVGSRRSEDTRRTVAILPGPIFASMASASTSGRSTQIPRPALLVAARSRTRRLGSS